VRYLVRRFLLLILTAWIAITINFILPRLMPGNPVEAMFARFQGKLPPQAMAALTDMFGLHTHAPLLTQYVTYLGQMVTGHFGVSITYFPSTVSQVIGQTLPWTVVLVGVTTVLAFLIGTGVGILAAWRRGSRLDAVLVPVGLLLNSMPYFWAALLILYVFAFVLGWFPTGGGINLRAHLVGFQALLSVARYAVLPAATIVLTASGGWILTMRNNMVAVLQADFVKFARARGLSDRTIRYQYAARNAILPNFTGFAMAIGFVVSGALLTEIVFSYPGIGYTLYEAVLNLDYPLMQALFLIIAVAVLVANFIADVVYVLLDPRIRTEGTS
jgi:peptide/nickel transport system permease protein